MPQVLTSDLNDFKTQAVKDALGDPFAGAPTPDAGLTTHLGGAAPAPDAPITAPDQPQLPPTPTAPLVAPPSMQQPPAAIPSAPQPTTKSGAFSPYDDVFAKYAGPLANDPMFISIVAAGTKAESAWNAGSTTGDGGHSWGLFQMHDRGAGAGMGNARLDPDAASAAMVPRYVASYQHAVAQGLTGAALAAATAQGAERSADDTGSAYAKAWNEIMGGPVYTGPQHPSDGTPAANDGAPLAQAQAVRDSHGDPFASAAQAVGDAASAVGSTTQSVLQRAQAFKDSLGNPFQTTDNGAGLQSATGGLPAAPMMTDPTTGRPAGVDRSAAGSINQAATTPSTDGMPVAQGIPVVSGALNLASNAASSGAADMAGVSPVAAHKRTTDTEHFNSIMADAQKPGAPPPSADDQQFLSDYWSQQGMAVAGVEGGGMHIADSGASADVMQGMLNMIRKAGGHDPAELDALQSQIDAIKGAPPTPPDPVAEAQAAVDAIAAKYPQISQGSLDASAAGRQLAKAKAEATGAAIDAPAVPPTTAETPPPALTPDVPHGTLPADTTAPPDWQAASARGVEAGRSGKPPAPPTDIPAAVGDSGPKQVAAVTPEQVADQNPLERARNAVNSAFQPIENIPDGPVKDALKRYAAAVGSQSQGARVMADSAGHTIAESGPMFTAEGMPVDSAAGVESAVAAKARADLNGVLQANGLNEKTPEIASILHNIHTPSLIAKNPLGSAVLGVNSAVKGSLFGLSNMHNYTEALTTALAAGPQATADYARAFLSKNFYDGVRFGDMAPKFDQAAMDGVTGLHAGQGGSDVYKFAQAATRSVIGAVGGAATGYEESLRAGDKDNALRNAGIGAMAGAAAGVASPALFSGLFQRAVPLAKVTVYDNLVKGGTPGLQAAATVNRTFGGLNYAQMGRSQTLQDAMRLGMTAPDWNESTIRAIGTAITGKGGGAGFQRGLLVKALVGPMIGSELLSYVLNGHGMQDNEPGHQLEVQVGTDTKGQGVYMGFMPGNYQAYGNLVDKIAGNPANTGADLGSFSTGRLGILPQAGLDAAMGTEYVGGPKAKNEAASLVSRAAPIGAGSTAQGLERGVSPQDIIASLLVGPNLRYGAVPKYSPPASRTRDTSRPTRPTR